MAERGRVPARPLAAAALAAAVLLLSACTEDPLTGPGPGEGERDAAETVELVLTPGQMAAWRDTTFSGFALPSDAPFLIVADRDSLTSRALLRYGNFPDSVTVDDTSIEVEEFRNAVLRLVPDSARSEGPGGELTLRLFTLGRPFDPEEATWEQASDGRSWDTPGGDLDQQVGLFRVEEATDSVMADTMSIPLGADTDSLLTEWRDTGGDPGLAVVMEGAGGRISFTDAALEFGARPAGRDTTVRLVLGSSFQAVPGTFISDPPGPPAGSDLRVGGLPASRLYLSFRPPRTVDGVRLEGATMNRAELIFFPLEAPAEPSRLDRPVAASAVELGADPFELGPKTPIGDRLGSLLVLDPDSLAAGRSVRVGLDSLMIFWASNPDSAGALEVGLRLQPDAQAFGFWEFGAADSPPELRPFVRIIVTPPSEFTVP